VFIAVVGCQAPVLPAPTVSSVEPAFGSRQESTSIVVYGSNFWPSVHVAPGNGDTEIDSAFDVWLVGPTGAPGRHRAASVRWIRSTRLNATVAPLLEPGVYDVEVEGPSGRSGTGAHAFTVTSSRAEELVLDAPPVWKVTQDAIVDLKLLGSDGVVVPVDVDVTLTIDEESPARLASETMTAEDDGHVLRGTLHQGEGAVTVTSEVPTTVTLSLAPEGDSEILDDTLVLVFEAGDDQHISIHFPDDVPPAQIVAGEPFDMVAELVDDLDNRVLGSSASVTLKTACGTWISDVEIADGRADFQVTPTRVTTPEVCPEETVVVQRGPENSPPSEGFQVLPGEVHHFDVDVTDIPAGGARAGDTLTIVVEPVDRYGNTAVWSGELTIVANTGGLQDVADCAPSLEGQLVCPRLVTVAHPAVQITATGGNNTAGTSGAFPVGPEDLPAMLVVAGPPMATAGIPFDADVDVQDQYGNPIDAASLTADAFALGDEMGDATCLFTNYLVDGGIRFSCTMTVARPAASLFAQVDLVTGTAPAFAVVNGPLDTVTLTAPSTVGAGAMFTITGAGTDAFGNPYILQSDPVVALTDDLGTLSITQIVLGADGTVANAATLTKAGATLIRASQLGVELGVSGAVQVVPGPGAAIALHPTVPWGFAGEPFVVSIVALDLFGNVADWEGDVLLSSLKTAAPDALVTVVDGFGEGTFTWLTHAIEDSLVAQAPAFSASLKVTVASDCGVLGPVADLTFAGFDEAVTCLDPVSGTAEVTADLAGSTEGAEPVVGYVAGVLGQPGLFDVLPTLDLTVVGAGPVTVGGLVMDEAGCGAEVFGTAWPGPDDGSAVGPIGLSSTASEIAVVDSVTIDVSDVVDCHRLPASFAGIHVRSTAGTLSGPVATGAGLEIFLDVTGAGSCGLDTAGGLQNSVAEVHAWVDSGAAGGVLSLPVVGDDVQPVVVAQSPSGATLTEVDEVRLTFSEAIQSAVVVPASFDIVGPIATTVVDVTLEAGDTEVVLALGPPADGTAGSWSVGAIAGVVDLAGNPLSGTWGPVLADYDGAFGDLAPAVVPLVCTAVDPAWMWFRPDGDPGPGVEADVLTLTLDAQAAPAWWVLDVFAEDGTRRFHDRFVPLGAHDTLVWNGRGFDGVVVPDGVWTLEVTPDDGFGNRAAGCSLPIVVANHGVAP
jgi:hypothetical protein